MITLNGNELNVTVFPDNTSQVWKNEISTYNEVVWHYEHEEGEIMHLQQLADYISSIEVSPNWHCVRVLKIPYLPYARQDKDISNEETFALHSFAKILNNQKWDTVELYDVHSKVAIDLIDRSKNHEPRLNIFQNNTIIFPDKGAENRYKHLLDPNKNYVAASKVRDQKTGYITHYDIDLSKVYNVNDTVLVVDDLCDGGKTFEILAESLTKAGILSRNLYVTHGLFSKGPENLLNLYDNVLTADTLLKKHKGVQVLRDIFKY